MATTTITLSGSRRRRLASMLVKLRPDESPSEPIENPITVVCVSDTHGQMPTLPDGDVLLHAGDMTEWGSFEEIQAQLSWLSSQPHKYKVVIAGNHDVLLDAKYMSRNAESNRLPWKLQEHASRKELEFGSCLYLENESVTLDFDNGRKIKVYGSPMTPKSAGNSAFQATADVWTNSIEPDVDVILTHGPPFRHLDNFPHAGSSHLLHEVMRVRPRLFVCGHIHAAYGKEDVVFDQLENDYEGIMAGWYGYDAILTMMITLARSKVSRFLRWLIRLPQKASMMTTLVNAAVVSGPKNELTKSAIVVEI